MEGRHMELTSQLKTSGNKEWSNIGLKKLNKSFNKKEKMKSRQK
jgi:hypothetical protein